MDKTMPFHFQIDERWHVSCDTAQEAIEFANLLAYMAGDKAALQAISTLRNAAHERRRQQHEALDKIERDLADPMDLQPRSDNGVPIKEFPRNLGGGKSHGVRSGRYEDWRLKAIEWIKTNGPARRSDICRAIGAKMGSMTPVFTDARFIELEGQLIGLAGVEYPPSKGEEESSDGDAEPGYQTIRERLHSLLVNHPKGMKIAEIAEKIGASKASVQTHISKNQGKLYSRVCLGRYKLAQFADEAPGDFDIEEQLRHSATTPVVDENDEDLDESDEFGNDDSELDEDDDSGGSTMDEFGNIVDVDGYKVH